MTLFLLLVPWRLCLLDIVALRFFVGSSGLKCTLVICTQSRSGWQELFILEITQRSTMFTQVPVSHSALVSAARDFLAHGSLGMQCCVNACSGVGGL